jgi:hypothetical protein
VVAKGNKSKGKTPYSGFLLAFEPKRTDKVAEELCCGRGASESFSAMDWAFERREIVLLSLLPGEISIGGVALMERKQGSSGGTGKLMMRLFNPIIIDNPITAEEIISVLDLRSHTSSADRLIRIPPTSWLNLLNTLKKLRPSVAGQIDVLISEREMERQLQGDSSHILRLMEQRDAIGLTLDIAGLDRKSALRTMNMSNVENATSVLDLLEHEPLHEQDMIRHDQMIFKDLLSDEMRHGSFSSPSGREVRVHVYDKKLLETVLGVDLLIYQECYKTYLLLQYKVMKPMAGKSGKTWSYRVDDQIKKQIDAMDRGLAAIQRQPAGVGGLMDWRLNSEAFYFKFCQTTRPDAREDALISGITLGRGHLKRFLELPESEGENGKGRRIGYDNCPRYFNNTQFVELVREGWIGCDQQGYSLITDVIKAGQKAGKQAMLAVVAGAGATNALDRGWRSKK